MKNRFSFCLIGIIVFIIIIDIIYFTHVYWQHDCKTIGYRCIMNKVNNTTMLVNRIDMHVEYENNGRKHKRFGIIPMSMLKNVKSPIINCNTTNQKECNETCVREADKLIKKIGTLHQNLCMFRMSEFLPKCMCIAERKFTEICSDGDYYCGCCFHPFYLDQLYASMFLSFSFLIKIIFCIISYYKFEKTILKKEYEEVK